jgi:ribosomal-protein-alanine N-acetyltransferase
VSAPRVILRPPEPRDGDAFVSAVRASRALHHPWAQPPDDADSFAAWLESGRGPATERCLVVIRDGGGLAGCFGISQIFYGPLRSAYLGYFALEPHAGAGYMREGLGLVLRHAFGPLGLHRLEANIQPGNAASIGLVKSAGFRREGFSPRYLKIAGRWRDHERWAILAEDVRGRERAVRRAT